MLMESFEVENFRSLKHLKLEKLARVNLLVGKGNVGKSSMLEAFFALMGAGSPEGFLVIEKERGLAGEKADFKYLFHNFDARNAIKLSATHREVDSTIADPQALLSVTVEAFNRRETTARLPRKSPAVTDLVLTVQMAGSAAPVAVEIKRGEHGEVMTSPTADEMRDYFATQVAFPAASRYGALEILTTTIDRLLLSEKIEFLKFKKAETTLLPILRSIDSRIASIELGAGGQIYVDLGSAFATLSPINLMGEGIQRLLDVVSSLAVQEYGVVLIDEIDNGLHYSALRILWKGILQAARAYDVQVFATTHSAEALRHLTWVLDEEENARYRDDVAAYTLIRAEDDTVRSYRYGAEQLEYALEHDIEVRN